MEQITPKQALVNLYTAARQLNVNADTHEQLHQMAKIIEEALTPKKDAQDATPENS